MLVPPSVLHRQPLLLILTAAATGIVIDSIVELTPGRWMGATLLLILWYTVITVGKQAGGGTTIAVVLVILPLAALWHSVYQRQYDSTTIGRVISEDPQPAICEGVVDRPVALRRHPLAEQSWRHRHSPWQTNLEIRLVKMRQGLTWTPIHGRVLVNVHGRQDQLQPGDSIRVYGTIQAFSGPSNPGGQDFRQIYRRRNLHARMRVESADQIVVCGSSSGWPGRWIATITRSARERLARHTGAQSGPLAIALVLGQREWVDPDQRDQLMATGTVHLLSVSGLHLAIVVVLAHWTATLLRFPPQAKFIWVIGVCLLYTAVTGARPPVVRAAVLVATFMVASLVRRPSQPINTLSLAALIIVVWNPSLIFAIGVQLSFLAVATLLLCRPQRADRSIGEAIESDRVDRLHALIDQSRSKSVRFARSFLLRLGQALWYSACVTAISSPLVWHQFHIVSPISVVTNVLLSPILFVALAAGVATVVVGTIEPLGCLFGTICDHSIAGMSWIIESAVAVPLGHLWLPAPPKLWVFTFYGLLLVSMYLPPGRLASTLRYGWVVIWVSVAWCLSTTTAPLERGSIEATFVDVGHGTCVVLRSGDAVWLYDCGRLGNDAGRSREIDSTLWSLGITRIDGIFLSHADSDHFNALPGVLQHFRVGQIVTPPGMFDRDEPAVARVRQVIERAHIPIREVVCGDTEVIGSHQVSVLHPPAERVPGTDNANSMVLSIRHGGTTLILPGDLEPPGTAFLIDQQRPPPGGVLMAPHHGSLRMDAASVLQWGRPRETIVSGGRRAKRPEVEQMLSSTGSGVHVTSQVGAIRVVIDAAGRIEIRHWSVEKW